MYEKESKYKVDAKENLGETTISNIKNIALLGNKKRQNSDVNIFYVSYVAEECRISISYRECHLIY